MSRPHRIERMPSPVVRVSAACADNLFIGSAGMLICGSLGLTKMQSGSVPALSHGSSGMRQVVRPGSCAACKRVAAAKPADVFGRAAEVDHRVPLFRVWNECRDDPWPKLLDYWGLPNLQVINRDVHTAKCATEARDRRTARYLTSELP